MILAPFDYAIPTSLDRAVALLKMHEGARVLAGGQSLLTEMKLHHIAPSLLVDLGNIPELHGVVRNSDGTLRIGAMTTLVELLEARNISGGYKALLEALKEMGDPQTRNRATFGGSLVDNQPGNALHAVALVFEATLAIFGSAGTTSLPASTFIADGFQGRAPDSIITAINFPPIAENSASTYEALNDRASGRAICGVAVHVVRARDGSLSQCRVAMTGATTYAQRLPAIENALSGKQPTTEQIQAAAIVNEGPDFISDLTASAEYRAHLAGVLAARALTRVVSQTTEE